MGLVGKRAEIGGEDSLDCAQDEPKRDKCAVPVHCWTDASWTVCICANHARGALDERMGGLCRPSDKRVEIYRERCGERCVARLQRLQNSKGYLFYSTQSRDKCATIIVVCG